MKIEFIKLGKDAQVPTKANETDAGFDVYISEDITLRPGETVMVGTGICMGIPEGYEGEIRGRSGLNSKTKIFVANGTIDSGYQGEVKIILDHLGMGTGTSGEVVDISSKEELANNTKGGLETYYIPKGSRIAQLLINKVPTFEFIEVKEFTTETDRGGSGFGSSGV